MDESQEVKETFVPQLTHKLIKITARDPLQLAQISLFMAIMFTCHNKQKCA